VLQVPVLPQVPFPGQAVLQQMPLTQLPLVHSAPPPHEAPLLLVVHPPVLQVFGVQMTLAGVTQVPAPLQNEAGVNVAVLVLQEAAPQPVVLDA